eukprot:TRINITY_DN4082_c0_g1_i1.p1 TRINITY_DN4082_c0_g1~~TRINITY_DN4082_c0_g1_i1.p1  ORF type:complete len:179 (+),score=25.84 TRINITY_DN4082_c0_g1_i1:562-1098(+)
MKETGSLLLDRISTELKLEPSSNLKNYQSDDLSVLKIYSPSYTPLTYTHPGLLTFVTSESKFVLRIGTELTSESEDDDLDISNLTGRPNDLIVFSGIALQTLSFSFFRAIRHIYGTQGGECLSVHYELRADPNKELKPFKQGQGSVLQKIAGKVQKYPEVLKDIVKPYLEANPLCSIM